MDQQLDYYIKFWQLTAVGEPIQTNTSILLPSTYQDKPTMLKIALLSEEQLGNDLMCWWKGQGAAMVLAQHASAILLERAEGTKSLIQMANSGLDNEATVIICDVISQLHAQQKPHKTLALVPLARWFKSLDRAAKQRKGIFAQADQMAKQLIHQQKEIVVLHGDIHHENILDFGNRGWLAIDPKGLIGDRGFEYANLFCNPSSRACIPGRFEQQLVVVAKAANLDTLRLLQWILAYAGLSAAWHYEDGTEPDVAMKIAEMALARLRSV
ncbi:MAG: hypothetical protein EPN84_11165 [Legionella sp.]|nr:MAG: hypothetical protein EPN84_11165 [Legionella sp.]